MTSSTLAGRPVAAPAPGPASGPGERGGRRWLMLTVLLLGQFMAILDVLVVNVAMPVIGTDLRASGASLQLVVGGYTVAYAMLLITGARLGDLYGRRRMYLVGVGTFTVASLACGLAPDSLALVGCRFVQGAGAAVMVPQIMSVIQRNFTGKARAKALSAYAMVLSGGAVAGLVVGGILVNADLFGWGWWPIFFVNVPAGLLLVALVPWLVPADRPVGSRRLDLAGLAIASSAVFLVVLPLVVGHEVGWPVWTYACVAAGLALAGVFVRVERWVAARGGDPLLNLEVLRAPGLATGLTTLACGQVTYGGLLFVLTLHLQAGLGDSALRAGLVYLPMATVFGLVGFCWRALPARIHHAVVPVGLALCAVAYVTVSVSLRGGAHGGPGMWTGLALVGAGLGLSGSPLLTQSLVHVPVRRAADASGVLTTTIQLGQVIGIAVFGTVFLSLRGPAAGQPRASATALSTTGYWLAGLAAAALVAAVPLARTVRRAAREA
ncbi:MAG: MFS transporter [Mycobacteriales bacterium]